MNSLKIKLLGLITLIVILIVSLSAYFSFELQKQMITQIAHQDVAALTGTIKNSIAHSMLSNHKESVREMLRQLREHDAITGIRIYDDMGRVVKSARSSDMGRTLSDADRAALKDGDISLLQVTEGGEYSFRFVSEIRNLPACHSCHTPSASNIGILEIDLSLKYLTPFLERVKQTTIITTLIILLLIVVTITVFLVLYVDRPIQRLIRAMQKAEQGEFEQIDIASSAEMHLLSASFSRMVEKFRYFINTTVRHERELAVAQEKLAHHHEIHQMNEKLEEQLKEIENLNISLEERIEEIEEANYKIADLAGELEDKNTTLEKTVARLSTLHKVGMAIASTMELDLLFQLLVKTTMDALNADIGYILLHNRQADNLCVTILLGHEKNTGLTSIPMKPSSVSTWVIRNKKPLLIQDINQNPEFDRFSALGYERKTLICVPLTVKDELIGTMTVVNKIDNSVYTSEDMELLTTLAAQAGIALHNAKLYEEQQQNYLSTIQALVSAIEASDSYTSGHSERVTRYSLELARMLDLPSDRVKILERAAMLHDIGKIGIDLTLLHKEDRLTPQEIGVLQQHPQIGMKILEPIQFLRETRICIGQHHERYDGQGYPNRVPKEKLLLESKILAIADAFDAMTTDRPYRKALPLEVALQEIALNAGTQFDPEIASLFIELAKEGKISFPTLQASPDSADKPSEITSCAALIP